ncbi:hypothetical protein GJAV_G00200050 [Gymnothorax javanicus]|nr:hypothetical protein GJAV_G00200050 [Gymnothorax javanicus]
MKQMAEDFESPVLKKIDVWKRVAADMALKGYNFGAEACDNKSRQLKHRYKTIVDNKRKTGSGATSWVYFSAMENLLAQDPSVEPVSTRFLIPHAQTFNHQKILLGTVIFTHLTADFGGITMDGAGKPVSRTILKEYQDDIESEEVHDDRAFWRKDESFPRLGFGHPAGRSLWHPFTVLSVSAILLLALIITVAVNNVKVDQRFTTLEKTVANLTLSVKSIHYKIRSGEETSENVHSEINALKESVKVAEHQLTTLNREMKRMDALATLTTEISQMKCTLEKIQKNVTGAGCCLSKWQFYESSCFFFSEEGKSWDSARDHCASMGSSLVILKDDGKWNWVAHRTMPRFYWIGLTDERTGEWEWVDGTPYYMNRRKWKPGQPDDWTMHGLGGGEDCAHLHEDGKLNDDHCSRPYRYVCESSVMAAPTA